MGSVLSDSFLSLSCKHYLLLSCCSETHPLIISFNTMSQQELDEITKEEDLEWLNIKEESILFNESFLSNKHNDLEEEKEAEKEDDEISEKTVKEENKVQVETLLKLM